MLRNFAEETTLHGLRYIVFSSTKIRQMIWLLLLVAAAATYLVMVKQSVVKYFSHPVSTEYMEVTPEDGKLTFPAVTICNLNRFVKTKINLPENDENFEKLGLNLSVCNVINAFKTELTCGQALLCAFELFGTAIVENCSETTKQHLVNALNATQEPIVNLEEFWKAYGYDFSAMFSNFCRFAKIRNCTAEDFTPTLTEVGLCFTFNSGRNGSTVRHSRWTGAQGGLSVLLDVQANESTIGELSRGLRVILHEQESFVNFEHGVNVFPGSHALIAVSVSHHQRLPSPYKSACVQRSLPPLASYTKDGCLKQCRANWTIMMCGCRQAGVPETFTPNNCSCGVPCDLTDYVLEVSYSYFPDSSVSKILKHTFGYSEGVEYQRKNLVFLQVGFKHLQYQIVKETPSYGIHSLLGDIGGNMGLFLGCSVLTIAEFVDLAWSGILRRINRIKDQSADEDEGSV